MSDAEKTITEKGSAVPSDLTPMRARALAATRGPWETDGGNVVRTTGLTDDDGDAGVDVCEVLHYGDRDGATAAHIAGCDPQSVIALIDRVEQAEARYRRRHQETLEALSNGDAGLAYGEKWKAHAEQVERERDEARAWVRRLVHDTQVITCAFCGESYPPGTPVHGHDALTAHVKVCAKHPMREVEAEVARLRHREDEIRAMIRKTFTGEEVPDILAALMRIHDEHAATLVALDEARQATRAQPTCANPDCEDGAVPVDTCSACDGTIYRQCDTCKGSGRSTPAGEAAAPTDNAGDPS